METTKKNTMNKKNWIALLLITVLSTIAVIVYAASANYSISEITADNYKEKLKENTTSILYARLSDIIPDQFPLASGYEFSTSNNFQNNGWNIVNKKTEKGNLIEISS